jgi:hypothetical protein
MSRCEQSLPSSRCFPADPDNVLTVTEQRPSYNARVSMRLIGTPGANPAGASNRAGEHGSSSTKSSIEKSTGGTWTTIE